MSRIIRRGLTPWPKLFQNLRASRETELLDDFNIKVVCEWIGNSQPVAIKHYVQLRDSIGGRRLEKKRAECAAASTGTGRK